MAQRVENQEPQDILLEVATLIAERQSMASVFAAFAERVLDLADFNYASLLTWDPEAALFREVAAFPRRLLGSDTDVATYTARDVHARMLAGLDDGVSYRAADAAPATRSSRDLYANGLARVWSVAITDGELVVGIMTVARESERDFSGLELTFLRRAARLLGSAVRDELRVIAAERDAVRSRLLSELSLQLNAGRPIPAMFEHALEVLQGALPAEVVLVTSPGEDNVTMLRGPLEGEPDVAALLPLLDADGHCRRVSVGELPLEWCERLTGAGVDRILLAPLFSEAREPGLLVLGRRHMPFHESDGAYIDVVAALLGQAIAAQERRERDRCELLEQRTLSWLLAAATHEAEPRRLTHAFALQLRALVDDPIVVFGFLQPDGSVTFDMPGGGAVPIMLGEAGDRDAHDQWVHDVVPEDGAEGRFFAQLGVQSCAITAARVGGVTLGYLLVGSRSPGYRFEAPVLSLLQLVAQLTGPAMQQAREAQGLERERSLLQLTLGSLNEGILLLDNELRVAYHNEAGSRVAEHVLDRSGRVNAFESALPRSVAEHLQQSLASGEPTGGRWQGRLDGEQSWIDYRFIPLEHSEYRLVCVVRDATEEVRLQVEQERHREELERAERLAALGGLVGGVAHELNNPLTAIMGFAELLGESISSGPEREDLEAMQREAERARKIVQDLLFMARPAPVERKPFTVDSLLGHIERVRHSAWLRAGIDVRVEADDRDALLVGSEDRMTQVLLNLITNAEEAVTGREHPLITLRAITAGNEAVLEVEDNGKGMDEETRARIFEPFFTTRNGTGTGLGLSVSHGIVQAHEGRIEVESTRGAGTCFRITLPLAEPAEDAPQEPRPIAHHLRVLVVDDEPTLRTVCQRLVRSMGHECTVASDSEEAVSLLTGQHFDLVLCDYRLASTRADDVLDAISGVDPTIVERVVIATGAAGDPGVRRLTERYGLRLLPKPYGADEITRLLEGKEAA